MIEHNAAPGSHDQKMPAAFWLVRTVFTDSRIANGISRRELANTASLRSAAVPLTVKLRLPGSMPRIMNGNPCIQPPLGQTSTSRLSHQRVTCAVPGMLPASNPAPLRGAGASRAKATPGARANQTTTRPSMTSAQAAP